MTTMAQGARVRQSVTLHGRDIAYHEYPGTGDPYVLLHGVGSSADGWEEAASVLHARGAHVISVDLPGHGDSSKGPGDYSLGSLASAVRDLLAELELDQVVLVGHSLGGGVALQFIYQFPQWVSGLVLVSSGGLGPETSMALRLAAMPGSGLVLKATVNRRTVAAIGAVRRGVKRLGGPDRGMSDKAFEKLERLSVPEDRNTFLATLRSVVDFSGQRVSALEKLQVSATVPVLIVWGEMDTTIPVAHGEAAHALLPDSELVVFPDVGHEPHRGDAQRFADVLDGWRFRHGL